MISYSTTRNKRTVEFKLDKSEFSDAEIHKIGHLISSRGFKYRYYPHKYKGKNWASFVIQTDTEVSREENKLISERFVAEAIENIR